jgi:hypothetical protein
MVTAKTRQRKRLPGALAMLQDSNRPSKPGFRLVHDTRCSTRQPKHDIRTVRSRSHPR